MLQCAERVCALTQQRVTGDNKIGCQSFVRTRKTQFWGEWSYLKFGCDSLFVVKSLYFGSD